MNRESSPPSPPTQSAPQARSTKSSSTASTLGLALVLSIGACCVWFLVIAFGLTTWEETHRRIGAPWDYHSLMFDTNGRLLIETTVQGVAEVQTPRYVDIEGRPQKHEDFEPRQAVVTLSDWRIKRRSSRVTTDHPVKAVAGDARITWFFHDAGVESFVEGFDQTTALPAGYIGPKGFGLERPTGDAAWRSSGEQVTQCVLLPDFENTGFLVPLQNWGLRSNAKFLQAARRCGSALIVSQEGHRVDVLDVTKRQVQVLYEGDPVRSAAVHVDETSTVALRTDRDLVLIPLPYDSSTVKRLPIPEPIRKLFIMGWHPTPDGSVFVVPAEQGAYRAVWVDAAGVELSDRTIAVPPTVYPTGDLNPDWVLSALQSPLAASLMALIMSIDETFGGHYDLSKARALGYELPQLGPVNEVLEFGPWIVVVVLSSLFWSGLAVRRLNSIVAPRGDLWFWGLWVLVWGLPGYMAFRVHRAWPVLRRCTACDQWAPCNEACCARCGVEWGLSGSVEVPATVRPLSREEMPRRELEVRPDRQIAARVMSAYSRSLDVGERVANEVALRLGLPPGPVALVVKESRLVAGLLTLAGIVYAMMLGRLMGVAGSSWFFVIPPNHSQIPFIHDQFLGIFLMIAIGVALLLAVLQVGAEMWGDAWLFWLHRPVSRRTLIASKLVVGLSASWACSAVPILLYGWWCSLPNRVAAPFEWSMTVDAWRVWWLTSTVYLGTFLSLLRPGRWWATRCFPLAAVVWVWMALAGEGGELLVVLVDVALVTCILFVAKDREYP